ncbi:MAG: acyl-CoA thioesterase [Oligoflexia bacterium]|nr:acyl-CoA thioesterase [Oligoflexia bacterium]
MKSVFESQMTVPFHMADPAGIVFFGHIFSMAHSEYEKWLTQAVGNWDKWFNNPEWIAPIKKTTADYLSPMKAGQNIKVKIFIKATTESSFTTFFEFYNSDVLCAQVEMLQVFCDKKTLKKIPIPTLATPLLRSR